MAKTYTPVGWEDGEIISPAMANLTTGEVTPAQVSGTTPVNAENLNKMDQAIKDLYDEGTTSKDIVIGTEEETTEDTKLLIETDSLASLGTEVVDSLDGNETNKAPSVMAVNNALGNIVESGSNENGNYVKFSDGTMICRGTTTISITTSEWGSLHVCDWTGTIAFPATFIAKPTVSANSSNNSGAISKLIATSNAITAISIFRGTSVTNVDYAIDYIAMGRWK